MDDSRQLRVWFMVLYPNTNQNHLHTLCMLKNGWWSSEFEYAFIGHQAKYENGELVKKFHVHLIIWTKDGGIRRNTLIKRLMLNDSDLHLIMALDEFLKKNGQRMFKTTANYIDYCTHKRNSNKPDKYEFTDYFTDVPDRIKKAVEKVNLTSSESFDFLYNLVMDKYKNDYNSRLWDISTWYEYSRDMGQGDLFFKHWNKIIKILQEICISI